jgi:hypothetical protein
MHTYSHVYIIDVWSVRAEDHVRGERNISMPVEGFEKALLCSKRLRGIGYGSVTMKCTGHVEKSRK